MLNHNDIVANFSIAIDLEHGITRASEELPTTTYYNYFRFGDASTEGNDLLVISKNIADDDFASSILLNAPLLEAAHLQIHPLASNKYGFSHLILAPANFHSHFKGALDDKRDRLILCLPVHCSEFSGDESIDDFYFLRRKMVDTQNWQRTVAPKIFLHFDNPKTGGGTYGTGAFVNHAAVLREIDNLDGAANGFLEITNYRKKVIEILSPGMGQLILIRDRDDARREFVSKEDLVAIVWRFLTD
ncbi:hypothetical protein INH39_16595 [Massilia violaceinigra]|uniref:Uncharacterized protein n=1 Tax=Massilia violaceinigra TaxID=2045208 RepID=A0ABY4AFD3_9BURK|nr:hypothetical protein [Massilia violaceinigra]UOD33112.1 hypothetical protein INH39_16595 [Massilia violaceinigra]